MGMSEYLEKHMNDMIIGMEVQEDVQKFMNSRVEKEEELEKEKEKIEFKSFLRLLNQKNLFYEIRVTHHLEFLSRWVDQSINESFYINQMNKKQLAMFDALALILGEKRNDRQPVKF